MKKQIILISALLTLFSILISSFAIVIYAHSGKTDSSGGHYDHSTGKYHYHHGYSAHQHYDMDGDGDIDCPYKFDGKPIHNSTSNNNVTVKDEISSTTNTNTEKTNKLTVGKIFLVILKIIGFSIVLLMMGAIIWIWLYMAVVFITTWIYKKFSKNTVNESIVSKVAIITIVILAITLASITVLLSEGIL